MSRELRDLPSKQVIREKVWAKMEAERVVRFPGAYGRIPNFAGAERAAKRATELSAWALARVIKANPDSPQRPLRRLALEEGKILLMAVPRLREKACFILLDPKALPVSPHAASSIQGAFQHGVKLTLREVPPIDLILAGSVAVARDGARIGKGGGFSDLEYALLRHFGKVSEGTPVLSTVHPLQVLDDPLPMTAHDVPLSFIVTEEEIVPCPPRKRPAGILWDHLTPEKIHEVPVLKELSLEREGGKKGAPLPSRQPRR